MSNTETRLNALERQLRRTRLALGAVVGVVLLACAVAAEPAFVALVTKSVEVKNPKGDTVIEMKNTGDVTVGGAMSVKGEVSAKVLTVNGKNLVEAVDTQAGLITAQAALIANQKFEVSFAPEASLFGATELLKGNQEYVAKTDGFVTATSSWSIHGLELLVNGTPQGNPLSSSVVSAKDLGCGLSVSGPVKKGATWRVRYFVPGEKDDAVNAAMRVYWIPISVPTMEVRPKKGS